MACSYASYAASGALQTKGGMGCPAMGGSQCCIRFIEIEKITLIRLLWRLGLLLVSLPKRRFCHEVLEGVPDEGSAKAEHKTTWPINRMNSIQEQSVYDGGRFNGTV